MKPDDDKKTVSTASSRRPASRPAKPREQILSGLAIAPGIALGTAHVMESGVASVPEYDIPAGGIDAERRRFAGSVAKSRRQISQLKRKTSGLAADMREEIVGLLDAHQQMLENSRLVRGVDQRIAENAINAEAAVQAETADLVAKFEAMDDAYLAARGQEIRELGNRLLRNLDAADQPASAAVPEGAIIVADELTPADTALLDPEKAAGIATELGGAEGHTAIMARALGLPTVLGVEGLTRRVAAGATVIIDGDRGLVIVDPGPGRVEEYHNRIRAQGRERRRLARLRRLPATTKDGQDISLHANLELPREIPAALGSGAQGIGLLRTEFIYMNRSDLPGEDEQFRALRKFVDGMEGRQVTIRTLDIGGDKLAFPLADELGHSPNPALGLRALRLSLRAPDLLDTQLAAILRAGALGPVRILLPMVASSSEVVEVRQHLKQVARRLARNKVKIADPLPPLGVMIEVPGAALTADSLADVADFFAIGTNDLTMYTLATDRSDEQVAHLYNPLHPAVLRLIQFTTQAALRARIPVSVCGEIAGDPTFTALLLGLGIRELSMAATALPRVKERIRALNLGEAKRRAEMIMIQGDSGRIAAMLSDFNELI